MRVLLSKRESFCIQILQTAAQLYLLQQSKHKIIRIVKHSKLIKSSVIEDINNSIRIGDPSLKQFIQYQFYLNNFDIAKQLSTQTTLVQRRKLQITNKLTIAFMLFWVIKRNKPLETDLTLFWIVFMSIQAIQTLQKTLWFGNKHIIMKVSTILQALFRIPILCLWTNYTFFILKQTYANTNKRPLIHRFNFICILLFSTQMWQFTIEFARFERVINSIFQFKPRKWTQICSFVAIISSIFDVTNKFINYLAKQAKNKQDISVPSTVTEEAETVQDFSSHSIDTAPSFSDTNNSKQDETNTNESTPETRNSTSNSFTRFQSHVAAFFSKPSDQHELDTNIINDSPQQSETNKNQFNILPTQFIEEPNQTVAIRATKQYNSETLFIDSQENSEEIVQKLQSNASQSPQTTKTCNSKKCFKQETFNSNHANNKKTNQREEVQPCCTSDPSSNSTMGSYRSVRSYNGLL